MTEQEWLELLELEAPSILGVCAPGAEVLDISEPSFILESSESESVEHDISMEEPLDADSLAGYSPSPSRSPCLEPGFNLAVNVHAIPELSEGHSEAETFSVDLLKRQWATEADFLRLTELLPLSMRPFQDDGCSGDGNLAGVFSTGAYVYSASVGLMLHVRQFRAVSLLLASLVQSLNPHHFYSSISLLLNTRSAPHRDGNNHPQSENMVIPLSSFGRGHIWCETGGGEVMVNGVKGTLLEVSRPYITFQPKRLRCTMPWDGTRLVLVAYHIRSSDALSRDDQSILSAMGFQLIPGR